MTAMKHDTGCGNYIPDDVWQTQEERIGRPGSTQVGLKRRRGD